jgi:3-hydroxy-5-methyl-1-naphthoate 3-O-methyltransferase
MSKRTLRTSKPSVTPMQFVSDLWGARASLALIAAVDLDVFTAIAGGTKTAPALATALEASPRALERLLDSLVGLGYLRKRGSHYELTPVSEMFLVRTKHTFLGAMASESRLTLPGWMKLSDVIRSGKPVVSVDSAEGRDMFPQLVQAIFPLTYNSARVLVQALPKAMLKKVARVLDVAAGAAPWSLPFAQALPGVRVTALDLPEVTAVTRRYAEQFGVADRYDYVEGDLRQLEFGKDEYDLVILGHIIHSEGEKWGKALIGKSYRALKPGGTLVIAEMIPNDSRTGPVMQLLFGLNMIVHTQEGDVFTLAQYKKWLKEAGFKGIKLVEAQSPSPLILSTR